MNIINVIVLIFFINIIYCSDNNLRIKDCSFSLKNDENHNIVLKDCNFKKSFKKDDDFLIETPSIEFLKDNSHHFNMKEDLGDVRHISTKKSLNNNHHIEFQQYTGKNDESLLPVYNIKSTVHQDKNGVVRSAEINHLKFDSIEEMFNVNIDFDTAINFALEYLNIDKELIKELLPKVEESEIIYFPYFNEKTEKFEAKLSWHFLIRSTEPLGEFDILVKAIVDLEDNTIKESHVLFNSNKIIFHKPYKNSKHINNSNPPKKSFKSSNRKNKKIIIENNEYNIIGSGLVFNPNPVQELNNRELSDRHDRDYNALNDAYQYVELPRLKGNTFVLDGKYVDVTLINPRNSWANHFAHEKSRVYNFTRDDIRFEQVMAYYHIDKIQNYLRELGFPDDIRPKIRVNANWYRRDNSYYSGSDDSLHFGMGKVDDAEDAEVILHEFGHSLQFAQKSCIFNTNEGMSISEGFGDALSGIYFSDIGSPDYLNITENLICVGEWDTPPCLRKLNSKKMYPMDLVDEPHADGEIWSSALWNLFNEINDKNETLKLIIESHYLIDCNTVDRTKPNFISAAHAILDSDKIINPPDGKYYNEIFNAFNPKGIRVI